MKKLKRRMKRERKKKDKGEHKKDLRNIPGEKRRELERKSHILKDFNKRLL